VGRGGLKERDPKISLSAKIKRYIGGGRLKKTYPL
jgi:hypothetical protein